MVGGERLELSWFSPTDPKSVLSTNFSNRPLLMRGKMPYLWMIHQRHIYCQDKLKLPGQGE